MHDDTYWTGVLKYEIRLKRAVHHTIYVKWHNSKVFTAFPENRFCHYVFVLELSGSRRASCILCVSTSRMFAYLFQCN